MLQKDRLYRIQEKMKQTAMPQMLVTDPMAIYWLCGKLFAPGERFLGLLGSLTPQSPTKPSGPYFFDQIKIFLYGNTVIYVVYCSL